MTRRPPARVRRYRDGDREQVLGLAPRLTEGVAAWRDPAAVSRAVRGWVVSSVDASGDPDHAVFVAEVDGRIGGVITVGEQAHFTGQIDAYVGELAVAADLERRGIATQLTAAARDWASRRGLAFLTLETGAANEPARKLYAALGFLEEGVRLTKTVRDPQRPVRLLRAEHDALLPILRRTPGQAFGRPTACPGWSVRDVLAHCSAALTRVATGRLHAFTAELNEIDVAERRAWPLPRLLSELEGGYLVAASAIRDAGGRLDAIALGEWVHGGDVRAALGEPLAYASEGFDDACILLADRARSEGVPQVEVGLPDGAIQLGVPASGRPRATLQTDRATLIKIFAGRPADPADYELAGATTEELVVF